MHFDDEIISQFKTILSFITWLKIMAEHWTLDIVCPKSPYVWIKMFVSLPIVSSTISAAILSHVLYYHTKPNPKVKNPRMLTS